MSQPNQSETKRFPAPVDGAVLVTTIPTVTEREIYNERKAIVALLHSAYLQLNEDMAEFQQAWDAAPHQAFYDAACEGVDQGSADWIADQAVYFDGKTWTDLGTRLKAATSTSLDRFATYSKGLYGELEREVNKTLAAPADTLASYAWWRSTVLQPVGEHLQAQGRQLQKTGKAIQASADVVAADAKKAMLIFKHRAAIFDLPNLIATGRPDLVQKFVETELMEIDPVYATKIRTDPRFAVVLELIADHDTALSYISYVGLMLEAVPPNFYAYIGGKGAAYLIIEVVLLLVGAVLSAGAAAAARIGALVARLSIASARLAVQGKRLRRAKAAVDSFIARLRDLMRVVDELESLGMKLVKARTQNLVVRGPTRSTMKAKKENIRREQRCRVCDSKDHPTPRIILGEVVYK